MSLKTSPSSPTWNHGKTTLVDALLCRAASSARTRTCGRVMDSNELERERGITILAEEHRPSIRRTKINIVDTPGTATSEERSSAPSMVDVFMLLVDASEGPSRTDTCSQALEPAAVGRRDEQDRPARRPPRGGLNEIWRPLHRLDAGRGPARVPGALHDAKAGTCESRPRRGPANAAAVDALVRHIPPPRRGRRGSEVLIATWTVGLLGRLALGRFLRHAAARRDGGDREARREHVHDEESTKLFTSTGSSG